MNGPAFPSVRFLEIIKGSFYCTDNPIISLFGLSGCRFNNIIFNIEKKNFKQKELIQVIEKYSKSDSLVKYYMLDFYEFRDKRKPVLEKEVLRQKLIESDIKRKTKKNII